MGVWAAVDSSIYLLLISLGPMVTAVSLFAVLADDGHGQQKAMGLRRVAVASPCLTDLVVMFLRSTDARSQSWWLSPLASAVLAFSNQDSGLVAAVQASVLNILSVASVAVDFARSAVRAAAAPLASADEATAAPSPEGPLPQLSGPLLQLFGRVLTLAALHAVLAMFGLWTADWRCEGNYGAGDLGQQEEADFRDGGVAARGRDGWEQHRSGDATAAPLQRRLTPEVNAPEARTAGLRLLPAATGLGAMQEGRPAPAAAARAGRFAGVWTAFSAAKAIAADDDAVVSGQRWQEQRRVRLQKPRMDGPADGQLQGWEVPRRGCRWHGDFATEQRHVAAARLADAALLSYAFLEVSRRMCVAAVAPPNGSSAGGTGNESAAAGLGALTVGDISSAGAGLNDGASVLRQLRCLGALLVTSWGVTVLVINVIVILWPRPRRPRYAWLVNGTCSWVAGLTRAALLLLVAPSEAGGATSAARAAAAVAAAEVVGRLGPAAAVSTAQAGDWPSGAVDGGVCNGQGALTATVLLMSNLIASNLSPAMYGIQSAAAAAAGALLHYRLAAPAPPVPMLVMLYGSIWLAAGVLSYHLARACQPSSGGTMAALHRSNAAAAEGVSGGGGGDRPHHPPLVSLLTVEGSQATTSSSSVRRALPRPLSLGLPRGAASVLSGADAVSPGSVAASDLALRTLSRAAIPRFGALGQPAFPRSLSGVSSSSAWLQESHPPPPPPPPPLSRAGSGSPPGFSTFLDGGAPGPRPSEREGIVRPAAVDFAAAATEGTAAAAQQQQQRRPSSLLPLPPSQVVQASLESMPGGFSQPCRTSSLDLRHLQRKMLSQQPQTLATTTLTATSSTTTSVLASPPGAGGDGDGASVPCSPFVELVPGRMSPWGKATDALPARDSSEDCVVSTFVRRASSERPPTAMDRRALPALLQPVPSLQQGYSWGPSKVQNAVFASQMAPDAAVTAAATAAAAAMAAAAVVGAAGPAPTREAPVQLPAAMPAGPAPNAASGAANAAHAVYGDGGTESGTTARRLSSPGLGLQGPLKQIPTPNGSLSGGPVANANAAAAPPSNSIHDKSVLSSVILEADMYDRLLSSASSPFLLNPNSSLMRYPSAAAVASALSTTVASPSSHEWRAHQQPHQQPHQQYQHHPSSINLTSSGLPDHGVPGGGTRSGGGAAPPGAIAATGVAAAAPSRVPRLHRTQARGSDGEEAELRSSEAWLRTVGFGIGSVAGSESGLPRAADPGSRSRLERAPVAATASEEAAAAAAGAAEAAAPRQIIVLADGRQVYQSEVLAAATSVSPASSSTPLLCASANLSQTQLQGHGQGQGQAAGRWERRWAPGGHDLLSSMARSDSDALAARRAAAAVAASSPPPTTDVARHFSYTVRHEAGGGGGGGLLSSMEPLLSRGSYSRRSQQSGSVTPRDSRYDGEVMDVVQQWSIDSRSGRAEGAGAAQLLQPLHRTMSVGIGAVGPSLPYGTAKGPVVADAAATGRDVRGSGCGQSSLYGRSLSGRTSYTPRGIGGTSASSRLSSSYGPVSGAGSSGGALTLGATSDTSYGTAETGSSVGGGGNRGGGGGGAATPHQRLSLDLGRHLHDTGLIRIGEEEPPLEQDDREGSGSALFGTCADGFDGPGIGAGGAAGSGYNNSFVYGSESDRRSSFADRASNGTVSGDAPQSRRRLTALSYGSSSVGSAAAGGNFCGSSSIGSGLTGEAPGSVQLVTVPEALAQATAAAHHPQPRRRGQPHTGRGVVSCRQHHRFQSVARVPDLGSLADGSDVASPFSSAWSAHGRRSSVDIPNGAGAGVAVGAGAGSTEQLGSVVSFVDGRMQMVEGGSCRELSDSPTLQALLQSRTVASSSSLLPQLPVTAAVVAGAPVVVGGGSGSGGNGNGSGSGSGGNGAVTTTSTGAQVFPSARHLFSGSHRSNSNPSLLSFADVTLASNLAPAGAAVSAVAMPARMGSYSLGQPPAAVTLARGILTSSARGSSSGGRDVPRSAPHAATATATAAALPWQVAAAATTCAPLSGASAHQSEGTCASLRFLAFPQTLAAMPGSGSIGRGSVATLKGIGVTTASASSVATQRGSNGAGTAAESSSNIRLGVLVGMGDADGGGGGGETRTGSRPTLPALLATTAAAAAAMGNTSMYGTGPAMVGASPWASSAASAPLAAPMTASAGSAQYSATSGYAVVMPGSHRPGRLHMFAPDEDDGRIGAVGSVGVADADAAGRSSTVDRTVEFGIAVAAAQAPTTHSQPLSQPLVPVRRRGMSWFGQFLAPKRSSVMGSHGGGEGGLGLLPRRQSQLHPHPHPDDRTGSGSGGSGGGGGEGHVALDGRASTASGWGRSSQQRMMDDTARLSPARGVLRGLRKRIRSGVKSLGSTSGAAASGAAASTRQ